MLGQFGVTGDLALQQVESLSGGQKSRVAFAVLCGHSPNFLVLGTLRLHYCCIAIPPTVLYFRRADQSLGYRDYRGTGTRPQ